MKRRQFIKKAGLAAGALTLPYVLPGGTLFAPTGSRKVNHVVFCLFAGGVRNTDSVHKNDGNLMPNFLNGSETVSSDIAASMPDMGPSPLTAPLQNFGTLYKEFRYGNGPTGHFNGHTTALTGQYTNSSLSLLERPEFPTVFELYRKHNSPQQSALNSWWITHTNNLYPILNYSNYPGYGPLYGANQISPGSFFSGQTVELLINKSSFPKENEGLRNEMRQFFNHSFGAPSASQVGLKNTVDDAALINDWIDKIVVRGLKGELNNPWNVPGFMSGDMYNVFFAEEIMKEFKPELLVVNMFGVDVCHSNFTGYCQNLLRADYAVAHLWQTIQSIPELANDTVLIVAPEIGRNGTPNNIIDVNGRPALDHTTGDPVSKEIFCLLAGPPSVINQAKVVSNVDGESIDIVPTIAHILGFDNEVSGLLPGSVLNEAFV